MKFQVVNVVYHNFVPIKQEGNVVMARCTCCSRPRLAVYLQTQTKRIYFYHGYTQQIAEMEFNSLVKRQSLQSQD